MKNTASVHDHLNHCCSVHGCKFKDDDCPVVSGLLKQNYPCRECMWTFLQEVEDLIKERIEYTEG